MVTVRVRVRVRVRVTPLSQLSEVSLSEKAHCVNESSEFF
jgi:phosphate-selective porin